MILQREQSVFLYIYNYQYLEVVQYVSVLMLYDDLECDLVEYLMGRLVFVFLPDVDDVVRVRVRDVCFVWWFDLIFNSNSYSYRSPQTMCVCVWGVVRQVMRDVYPYRWEMA
jgi:hypothetical protein